MDWIYIAGFFDGEGYAKKTKNGGVLIQITQRKKEILEEIQRFLNYGTIYRKDNKLEYKGYDLRITDRKNVIDFIQNIKKYSFVKKSELVELETLILKEINEGLSKSLGKYKFLIKEVLEE